MSFTGPQLPQTTRRWLIIVILSMPHIGFPAGEPEFGRLFTTRDERQRLQQFRDENRDDAGSGIAEMDASHSTRQIQTGPARRQEGAGKDAPVITLKGLIYSKDRAGMVWINGQDGDAALDYRRLESEEILNNEVSIRMPVTGKSVQLKPGQSYHLDSGAVTDLEANAP